MHLLLAGLDEAGYGPLLGPLCVGMSLLRVPIERDPTGAPCLWKLLEEGVSKEAGRAGRPGPSSRVPIADSKQLKLSNDSRSAHPLVHLERGVLAFLRTRGVQPASDTDLLRELGSPVPPQAWYAGEAIALPHAVSSGELAICTNVLNRALSNAGVTCTALRLRVMDEQEFNAVASEGEGEPNKARTTARALGEHLRYLWQEHAAGPDKLGVACDRLGGRVQYAGLLEAALPECVVEVLDESEVRSRYVVTSRDGAKRMGIVFLVEAEQHHLTVALASMTAKLARELLMARFNRSWSGAHPELKPTAGYALDARRWLSDARKCIEGFDARPLVRVV